MKAALLYIAGLGVAIGCGCAPDAAPASAQQTHSGALVASPDGTRLYVAHPDADSVSAVDTSTRRVLHERLLASERPARDAAGRYEPAVGPRALALDATASTLYITGQRSGRVYRLDAASLRVEASVFVCSEPIGVLVSADDRHLFVACAQDDEVVELSAKPLKPTARVACPRKPWALAWAGDGTSLIATHFLGPGVSRFTTEPLALKATWTLDDGPPRPSPSTPDGDPDPTEPHGAVRGIYDAMIRPGSSELWVAHLMLGTDTAQPELDFERTVFPALTILDRNGRQLARLSVQAHPGDGGAFGDVVSGPHALAFSADGKLAFVADTNSEDVLVIDAERRIETQLVRPLPGHLPEAIAWAGGTLYVAQRNSEDIAAFSLDQSDAGLSLTADGRSFGGLQRDPMPGELRLGQKLFYSANSDDLPVTTNHWVACASCHLEGRSDAVTWKFAQGPRDTPTNAGGLLDTGFLFRTADRTRVQDYWQTIDVEQGGHFDRDEPTQQPLLDALAAFVNYAIPTPVAPSTDVEHALAGDELDALRARGEQVFDQIGCGGCHSGAAKTDSAAGNPMLDLSGPAVSSSTDGGVLLHDVGTCAASDHSPSEDVEHTDIDGHPRAPCAFDTPQLRGLWDSAPYLHDGSAATLADVLPSMLRAVAEPGADPPELADGDRRALIEYLRSL